MELPPELRAGIDSLIAGTPTAMLQEAAAVLSRRYRSETRDGRMHLSADLSVKAYLATRMPATFAAIADAAGAAKDVLPGFSPSRLLDIGAGPGTAWWAARQVWPSIGTAELLEASAPARTIGDALIPADLRKDVAWTAGNLLQDLRSRQSADLVTLCYVLDELQPDAIGPVITALWDRTDDVLLVVEPGTPAGWQRILSARRVLIGTGANVVAPCPHQNPCPLHAPDWCHFSRRVARSRLHRLTKQAEVPWEDEKYVYLAAARRRIAVPGARVIGPPAQASGRVTLKLCRPDGTAGLQTQSRRDAEPYRLARRAAWGDRFGA